MALPPFSKRRDDPAEKAFAEGRRPGERSQLGPFPSAIEDPRDFKNAFISQRFNPEKNTFWQQAFSQDTANMSQEKINLASQTNEPNFPEPMNQVARDFLAKYSGPGGAVERGLIEEDRYISSETLKPLTNEAAASRMNSKDQNTAGTSQFAGAGGVKV